MDSEIKDPRILLIDPDEAFGETLKSEFAALGGAANSKNPALITGTSMRDCQRFLSDRDYTYIAVFVNPKVGSPSWVACVKSSIQYRPGTPCYVIYDEEPKLSADQKKSLAITGWAQLPVKYDDLRKIAIGEVQLPRTLGGDVPSATATPKPQSVAPSVNEADLMPIELKDQLGGSTSLFDVFIRVSDGRFVQVLKNGDKFTAERLQSYREKGADKLFIPKQQQARYIDFCDELVSAFFKDPNITLEQKAREVTRYGEETLDFLRKTGVNESTLSKSKAFVGRVSQALFELTPKSDLLKAWMSNAAYLEHSVAITTIASLFLNQIGVLKPETYEAAGMACLLHDIGLQGITPIMADEDESKMNDEQRVEYRKHPAVGAQKLAGEKSVPAGVIKAIEQHHVRVNGGFPAPKGVLDLSPVAEIIGISEEFQRQLMKAVKDPTLDPVKVTTGIATDSFSKMIQMGFVKTFRQS